MGAVCKPWLSVCQWSARIRYSQLPWLMMLSNPNSKSTSKEHEKEARCFLSLSDNTIDSINFPEIRGKCCCGSFNNAKAGGWLLIIDENLEISLFHPWLRTQLQLPHQSTLVPLPDVPPREGPDVKILKGSMSDDASVVAVIYDRWDLAFCRTGDKVWSRIRSESNFYFDLIYHNGQFYAVGLDGRVGVCSINNTNPYVETLTEVLIEGITDFTRPYLVVDSANKGLLIVLRSAYSSWPGNSQTSGFQVYEVGLDETGNYKKKPVNMESLGDRIIFVGYNSSMLVMASEFPAFKGNCIYFTDDSMGYYFYDLLDGCRDIGVFDMEDKTIKALFPNRVHPTFSPPIWVAPPPNGKG
ncbi:hypothetical protein MRB53_019982 [Persea americana]|uniref:Uncharacterized protein n=1 Tax=Persea americana TaxID=3435 RepID=A0ACC2L076_PERAE|nr:hypothetical protein MRB53_019982 [Persea americana]